MRNLKKLFCLFIVLMFFVVVAGGCGGGGSNSFGEPDTNDTPTNENNNDQNQNQNQNPGNNDGEDDEYGGNNGTFFSTLNDTSWVIEGAYMYPDPGFIDYEFQDPFYMNNILNLIPDTYNYDVTKLTLHTSNDSLTWSDAAGIHHDDSLTAKFGDSTSSIEGILLRSASGFEDYDSDCGADLPNEEFEYIGYDKAKKLHIVNVFNNEHGEYQARLILKRVQ